MSNTKAERNEGQARGLAGRALGAIIGTSRRRGSVLVLVVGVLALMAILVAIYATLGQTDSRGALSLRNLEANNAQQSEIAEYLADVVARGTINVARQNTRTSASEIRDVNADRFIRTAVDAPTMDPFLQSQSIDPATRYSSQYLPSDIVPANEKRPPLGLPAGSVATPWRKNELDPRIPFTPFLASSRPDFIRSYDRSSDDLLTPPRDPNKPYLDYRDWAQISNPAPGGLFVNLANLRNNFNAKPGVGLEDPGAAFGLGNRGRMTYNLTLLDRDGRATLDMTLPAYWPFRRTKLNWAGGGGQVPTPYYPYDLTDNQISLFRPAVENRPGTYRVPGMARGYAGTAPVEMVPGDWEYLLNQYADADGDGILDSRWFELASAEDPGSDQRFGTDDDVIRQLISQNANLRLFVASRIIDLSGKVNVNTATQFRTMPSAANPAGQYPSDIDLERVLRMADVYQNWPRLGYEKYAAPTATFAAGAPSNYSDQPGNVPSYASFWTSPLSSVDRRVADDVGAAGFAALIAARVQGGVPTRGFIPGATPASAAASELAWDPLDPINLQRFRPLTVPLSAYPFDAYDGQDTTRPAEWRAEDRAALFHLYASDPGARMISGNGFETMFAQNDDYVIAPADALNPNRANSKLPARALIASTSFGIQDEIDLRTFEGVNDAGISSRLKSVLSGRFNGPPTGRFLHFSPLRDNRPRNLETLARDINVVVNNVAQRRPDGQMDDDAYLQAATDVRSQLTTLSGHRPLTYTDVTGTESILTEKELKVDLSSALGVLSGAMLEQTYDLYNSTNISIELNIRAEQAKRQAAITSILSGAADALIPFAGLRDANLIPDKSVWYVRGGNEDTGNLVPRAEHKLNFGADRASSGGDPYRGNSAEFALRASAHITANLVAGRQQYKTFLDPINPIHPDDRVTTNLSQTAKDFAAFRGGLGARTINRGLYPPVGQLYDAVDREYYKQPRFPRLTGNMPAAPRGDSMTSNTNFWRDTFYTDAYEFFYNAASNRPSKIDLRRTRSEAADRPIVFSLLIDESFRDAMRAVASAGTFLDGNNRFALFPAWSDVGQLGDLAPKVMGKLDLGSSKLSPPSVNPPPTSSQNPRLDPPRIRETMLSTRAMNIYGITPQPFIVQVASFMWYVDTNPNAGDAGDTEPLETDGGFGTGQPVETSKVTINPVIPQSGDRDSTGLIRPLNHAPGQQRGYPDHIVEIFAFQLHNPFDVPLSLSKLHEGRTVPDQTRTRFTPTYPVDRIRRNEVFPFTDAHDDPFTVNFDEMRYYIEFSKKYYALIGVEGDGDGTGGERPERYRAITLDPGETRWFYVADNDLATVWNRMRNAQSDLVAKLGVTAEPGFTEPWRPVERWIREQLMTFEPLGLSYDDRSTEASIQASATKRFNLPDARSTGGSGLTEYLPAGAPRLKDLKLQIRTQDGRNHVTFDNPPTRLVRVNPATMRKEVNEPQPEPSVNDKPAYIDFMDSRRAVRLWRVTREVRLNAHEEAGDVDWIKEGRVDAATGKVVYINGTTPIRNIVANDQLIDVLRDPMPSLKRNGDVSDLNSLIMPTLHRRLDARSGVPITLNGTVNSNSQRPQLAVDEGLSFINWGSIRRPADPKLPMPLRRDPVTSGTITDPSNAVTSEVPLGVIPAYCMEVKSSLPFRAGLRDPGVTNNNEYRSIRTSLNWDIVNGERRLKSDFSTFDDATYIPKGTDFAASGSLASKLYRRMSRRDPNTAPGASAGIALLLKRGIRDPRAQQQPVRLGRTLNLPPQLQDIVTGGDDTTLVENLLPSLRKDEEPVFAQASASDEYKQVLKDRLERLRNRSGRDFSSLYMQLPMLLPRIYRGEIDPPSQPELRPADILMVPAVGPYETPVTFDGRFETNPDRRWTTLSEAIAQALDYDFDDDRDGWPQVAGQRVMPADYRMGASFKATPEATQIAQRQGLAYPSDEAPEIIVGDFIDNPQINEVMGGCLERGCLRTDRFVPYADLGDDRGRNQANGVFDPPRDATGSGALSGDARMGAGIPMALSLVDKFRTSKYGSLTSKIPGTININTSAAAVTRTVPMLTPDLDGFMGPNTRRLNSYPASVKDWQIIGGGRIWLPNYFARLNLPGANDIQNSQYQSLYGHIWETYDIASTLTAYRDKSSVTTRSFNRENQPANFHQGISTSFRDDLIWPVDGRYSPAAQPASPQVLGRPPMGRQFFSGIPGLHETPGFVGIGEIMCARYAGVSDPIASTAAPNYQYFSIPNLRQLERNLTRTPILKPGSDYASDISIDRFARDGSKLAPSRAPTVEEFNGVTGGFGIGNNPTFDSGIPIEGLLNGYRDPVHQRGPLIPARSLDDLSEKYVIANAAMNTISVRSDVFCVWFLVNGYAPTDVVVPDPQDPMVPSLQKRYVMVVDRSNVTKIGDKPKVLFLQEVPVN